ncbi:MAG TPA: hypothetical protein V6C89_17015 [Drouetiella sp.]|jgi:hypothetical protein
MNETITGAESQAQKRGTQLFASGKEKVHLVPFSVELSTQILPPWTSTKALQVASPAVLEFNKNKNYWQP